jgi:hypothetical protein
MKSWLEAEKGNGFCSAPFFVYYGNLLIEAMPNQP